MSFFRKKRTKAVASFKKKKAELCQFYLAMPTQYNYKGNRITGNKGLFEANQANLILQIR